jgi:general stress protein YciG
MSRGFASMDKERQRAIASTGGKAAHEKGKAHEFDSEEGRRAGQIGGQVVSARYGRDHMVEIGRKGGISRGEKQRAKKMQNAAVIPEGVAISDIFNYDDPMQVDIVNE